MPNNPDPQIQIDNILASRDIYLPTKSLYFTYNTNMYSHIVRSWLLLRAVLEATVETVLVGAVALSIRSTYTI